MNIFKRKLTVCGSFGFGNAGDEAIPLSYHSLLKAAGVDYSVDVLSRYAKPDMPEVIGTSDASRVDAIRNQAIVVSGGGAIEHNEGAIILKCRNFLSQSFSSNIAFIGVSVEPGVDYDWAIKRKVKKVLSQSTLPSIYTRDMLSEITLRKLYPQLNIKTIGDLVLWLDASKLKPISFPKQLGEKYIAVSLSSCWSDEPEWYDWIVAELLALTKEHNANIVFMPMSIRGDDDRVEHKKIADMLENHRDCNAVIACINEETCPTGIAAVYRDAMLVVSMRLHGCVMAYGQRTPFVGISYHPKVVGFSYTVGLRKCVVPVKSPNKQSDGAYGFRFKDLDLEKGELLATSSRAIDEQDFSSLDYYKQRSLSTIKLFLTSIEANGK